MRSRSFLLQNSLCFYCLFLARHCILCTYCEHSVTHIAGRGLTKPTDTATGFFAIRFAQLHPFRRCRPLGLRTTGLFGLCRQIEYRLLATCRYYCVLHQFVGGFCFLCIVSVIFRFIQQPDRMSEITAVWTCCNLLDCVRWLKSNRCSVTCYVNALKCSITTNITI